MKDTLRATVVAVYNAKNIQVSFYDVDYHSGTCMHDYHNDGGNLVFLASFIICYKGNTIARAVT